MAKITKTPVVVGLDLGDRWIHLCGLDAKGEEVESGKILTGRAGLEHRFSGTGPVRIALEAGPQSSWIARQLSAWGHEVIVANPRQVRLISHGHKKSDRVDAQLLARLALADPKLLSPVTLRGEGAELQRALLQTRGLLVQIRTKIVNHVRSTMKKRGQPVTRGTSAGWARRCQDEVPEDFKAILQPLLELIETLATEVTRYDRQVEQVGRREPAATLLRQVNGVGPVTSLAFVATIENPQRFARSRLVGGYVGLAPSSDRSGATSKEKGITHRGDEMLRCLLVQSAQYILGPFGKDCDLRRYGLALVQRGGRAAKKRAVIAVARRLAVLLHRLWSGQAEYDPFYQAKRTEQVRKTAHARPLAQAA
ncbi:MAG: IS110 family transposase [Acidobacteriota bacterium]